MAHTTSLKVDWRAVTGQASRLHPREHLALAAEVHVYHERFDEPSPLSRDAGLMVNRHLMAGRALAEHPPVTRDSVGIDEDPMGVSVSWASLPPDPNDPRTGRLYRKDDPRTRHQVEWDFMAQHVEHAYRRYFALDPLPRSNAGESMRLELREWEKAEALARYALTWSNRAGMDCRSCHPCDVLFASAVCGGTSALLFGLATVAGLPCRLINTINHSTVELGVKGRWVWCDNLVGCRPPLEMSYQEMLENPHDVASLTDLQIHYADMSVTEYRAPYNMSASYYWRLFGWAPEDLQGRLDQGAGLSLPFDPTTAQLLYPGRRRYAFHVPAGWRPTVVLTKKGSWHQAQVRCDSTRMFRKVFDTSACDDNPVTGGRVKVWAEKGAQAGDFLARLDGQELAPAGQGAHLEHHYALDYDVPASLLQAGRHEFTLTAREGRGGELVLYPDALRPDFPASAGQAIDVEPAAFAKDTISQKVHH